MMKKLVVMTSLLALTPLTAEAGTAFGLTSHSSNIYSTKSDYTSPLRQIPTIDVKTGKFTFQITALETLEAMAKEDYLDFGVSGYATVRKRKITDGVRGVLQLGGSIDIQQMALAPSSADAAAAAAAAAEAAAEAAADAAEDENAEDGESADSDSSDDSPDSITNMWVMFQPRIGLEVAKGNKVGFGIYVVSGIGFARVPNTDPDSDDDQATELAVGTGLQISGWIR